MGSEDIRRIGADKIQRHQIGMFDTLQIQDIGLLHGPESLKVATGAAAAPAKRSLG